MARNVVPNTGVETIGTPDKRWSAIYADHVYTDDYVNVKQFGAKGDGVTDDTAAIQAAVNYGVSPAFLPVGTYIVSDTIYVNLMNGGLIGISGRSAIVASADFPSDKPILHFYIPNATGEWAHREKHAVEVKNFSIQGNFDNTTGSDGIAFGNITNETEQNGWGCTNAIFSNISISQTNKALILGNHVYIVLFQRIYIENKVRYCLYNPRTVSDSGENVTFVNCTFYRGVINAYRCSLNMYGCTVHLENQIEHSSYGKIGHLFTDGSYDFTDCHFEILNSASVTLRYCLYSVGAQINIQGGEFLCSRATYTDAIFATTGWYYFTPAVININNSAMQYFLYKLTPNSAEDTIAKGNVIIRAKGYMYNKNYTYNVSSKIYDTTNDAFKLDYREFKNLPIPQYIIDQHNNNSYFSNANISSSTSSEDKTTITISNINNLIGKAGVYKIKPVNGHRALHYRLKTSPISPSNLQLQVQFGAEIPTFYGVMFLNASGETINFDYNDSYHNDSSYNKTSTTGVSMEVAYTLPIPAQADFVLYGVGFVAPSATTEVSFLVEYCTCELI